MLNGTVQPVNDANERSKQTVRPYQSLWLAHWKQTGCDARGVSTSPNASRNEELDYVARKDGLTKGVEDFSRSASGGMTTKRALDIGDDFIKIGRRSLGNNSNLDDQDADALSKLKSLEESFVESSSHVSAEDFGIITNKYDKGKAAASICFRQRTADMRMLKHGQCLEHRQIDLHCERKMISLSQSEYNSDECLRESISCDHCLSMINRVWFPKMQKSPGVRLFPSQSNSSDENGTAKSHIDCHSHLKLQKCGHGLGTMRIDSGVEVQGGTLAGFPRFSQTSHDMLMTKKTHVYAFKETDLFGSKRVITNVNGNFSEDLHSVFPFLGHNKQKVPPFQALSSLKDSEVKEDIRDVKASTVTIRNELSAETDSVDVDSLKEERYKKNLRHSASNSTATTLTKAFNMESNDVSYRKLGQRWMNSELPDINIELPALTGGAASSPPNISPSSSKTVTLERDELLEHPKAKSHFSLDESPHADAGSRWLKRLKLSSNSSIQGGKSPDYASTTPQERRSRLFDSIPRSIMTRSKPNLSKHRGETSVLSEKIRGFELDADRFIENPNDKAEALLLSHAWIQRLLPNGGRKSKRKSGTEAVLEPESSKLALEKLEKEQLPSIAAMALMAKVLTCFQQCELQNKGSYTVWNTQTLL
ncbi:uncharacterized protein LOC121802296 isoform X1 [Salvia splendens]|uniref:uncharacterized protein LOC121802296 isoform X1 n=1 Tax=Salvia splendens TaxID=180675 RepID=UPI0011010965|nr:uncharacterized protein LOC121802296 isoform X1 [Salvia splendens]